MAATTKKLKKNTIKDQMRAKKLYEQGYSTREIGKIMGYHKGTVYSWLIRLGTEMRQPHVMTSKARTKRFDSEGKFFKYLYEEGFSISELERLFGYSKTMLKNRLKWAGTEFRSLSEARHLLNSKTKAGAYIAKPVQKTRQKKT